MTECKHGFPHNDKLVCYMNFKDCDHPDDPENCEYNQKGIEREE